MVMEQINSLRETTPRQLRLFGFLVGVVACGLSIWLRVHGKPYWPLLSFAGCAVFILGSLAPGSLKWAYAVWMILGITIGAIISAVLITLMFYAVVVPVGLVARLCGRDFLSRQWNVHDCSYWLKRGSKTKSRQSYERQF